jgi:hypothetical protein
VRGRDEQGKRLGWGGERADEGGVAREAIRSAVLQCTLFGRESLPLEEALHLVVLARQAAGADAWDEVNVERGAHVLGGDDLSRERLVSRRVCKGRRLNMSGVGISRSCTWSQVFSTVHVQARVPGDLNKQMRHQRALRFNEGQQPGMVLLQRWKEHVHKQNTNNLVFA